MTLTGDQPHASEVAGKDYIGISVVYFCHDGQNNFLMAKRSNQTRDEQGRWDSGGGAVEYGESIITVLKKRN